MKSKYVLIAFVLFCCSCQELIMKNRPFPAVDAGRIEIVPISEEKGEIIKVTNEIGENIPASKLIEDFFYVPLESIEESLFAYCNQKFLKIKFLCLTGLGRKSFLFSEKMVSF